MRNLEYLEKLQRGTADFPVELYCVSSETEHYVMPCHWHPEFEIILIRSGHLLLSLDEQPFETASGDIALLPEGVLHSGIPDDCVYDCIVFSTEFLTKNPYTSALKDLLRRRPGEYVIRNGSFPELSDITERLISTLARFPHTRDKAIKADSAEADQKLYSGSSINAESMICYGLLLEFFGALAASGRYSEPPTEANKHVLRLKSVLACIENNYNRELPLSELVEVAGLSPKYLCRAFSSLTGKTPVEYLNEYRVECACVLLSATDRALLDVAYSCGFNDQSYFIKLFKRYKGVTPGEYRRRSPCFVRGK